MQDDNKIMMSDDLRGRVPELEDEIAQLEDAFVIAAVEVQSSTDRSVVVGSLAGFVKENDDIKIDVRVTVQDGYNVLKATADQQSTSRMCQLRHTSNEINFSGPFNIKSPRILDFDPARKMCTLGFDLVKVRT